ncbi:MAG: hypothetical protein PVJ57_16380 [Phycisphaerae bacterium]
MLTRLRAAISRLVSASPAAIKRATDLQRVLEVRTSLAWQVFRLATAKDPFDAVPHIPQAESMGKLFEAARRKGFRAEVIDEAANTYEAFDRFVQHHAGDRGTFDAMIAALGGQAGEQISFKQRRAAFRANASLWGFQAATMYRCTIYQHDAGAKTSDGMAMRGVLGLRANRRIQSLPVAFRHALVERSHSMCVGEVDRSPWLLTDFCSDPPPSMSVEREGDYLTEALHMLGVGRTARVDFFMATTLHNVVVRREQLSAGGGTFITMPCEELVMDLLVPHGVYDPSLVKTHTYGYSLLPDRAMRSELAYAMPSQETVTYLGTPLDALHDPVVPRCPEMVRHVLSEVGWERTEFDIFRCRASYPILHTVVDIRTYAPIPKE